jgi:hypothetical protein
MTRGSQNRLSEQRGGEVHYLAFRRQHNTGTDGGNGFIGFEPKLHNDQRDQVGRS